MTQSDKTEKNAGILIDLESSNDAQAFGKPEEIIQREAMNRFFGHVKNSLKKTEDYAEKLKKSEYLACRYHDVIAVFGRRGSGKTTFILNMFKLIQEKSLENSDGQASGIESQDLNAIQVLPIIDPTLVEEKEHVFVNIISRIKQAVDKKYDLNPDVYIFPQDPCDSRCNMQNFSSDRGAYRDWLESLKRLAAGLPAISGIGESPLKKESWHDPVHVMEEGLKSVRASNDLEKNFHLYVNQSLKFIGKKAFILAFDDIDTDFKAGWPVLETIRKYLTTPQLITVLSGDPALYSKLIRKRQWEYFGDALLKYENMSGLGEGIHTDFRHMVDQLEEQYFLKILKPRRRIELKRINDLVENGHEIKIRLFSGEEKSVDEFLNQGIKDMWSVVKDPDLRLYKTFLLNEPIRTLVQLFIGMDKGNRENGQTTIDFLVETYLSTLHRHEYRLDVRAFSPRYALNRLARVLADNSLFKGATRIKITHKLAQ